LERDIVLWSVVELGDTAAAIKVSLEEACPFNYIRPFEPQLSAE
jgi:hypothetical protein